MLTWILGGDTLERRIRVLSLLLGSAVLFGWIHYGGTLDPTDTSWIFHEDPAAHVLGWEQFRNAPLLQYPITRNELYGLEWSSTLVFSDSIPIAALALRPFSALLPHPFQYLGWWIWLSLVLQAYWAAKLVALRSPRFVDAAIASVFFVTAPVLIERVGVQTAVATHWLLLCALWLYFANRGVAHRAWTLLLLLTVAVHAYLFVMVAAIWSAHLVRCFRSNLLVRSDAARVGASFAAVLVWMHALGYFVIGDGAAGGAWRSSFDLAGFVAPSTGARFGIGPSVYDDPWDGSAYLGFGVILLSVAIVARLVLLRDSTRPAPNVVSWRPLVVIVAMLAAFAITNYVTVANRPLFSFPIPGVLERSYETFRGAIRMIWPAYYLILIVIIWGAVRAWSGRARTIILAGAAVLQCIDLAGMGAIKRDELGKNAIKRPLEHPVWEVAGRNYRRIVSVPAKHRQREWPTLAWFAMRHGMGTNIGYLSRSERTRRLERLDAYLDSTATGRFDRETIYYYPSPVLWDVARAHMGPEDAAVVADGFRLVVPDGRRYGVSSLPPPTDQTPLFRKWISFGEEDNAGLLLDGWSWLEPAGTWSIVPRARLVLPVPAGEQLRIDLRIDVVRSNSPRTLRFYFDEQVFEVVQPAGRGELQKSFTVTSNGSLLRIDLEDNVHLKTRPNRRPLRMAIKAARVQLATDPDSHSALPDWTIGWSSFAEGGEGRKYLAAGWSWGEVWGTWSNEKTVDLVLPTPPNKHVEVQLRWLATSSPGAIQNARVRIGDRQFDVLFVRNGTAQVDKFEVVTTSSSIPIQIEVGAPVEAEGRLLGVGLIESRVVPLSE